MLFLNKFFRFLTEIILCSLYNLKEQFNIQCQRLTKLNRQ
jgi:hypothetical protein